MWREKRIRARKQPLRTPSPTVSCLRRRIRQMNKTWKKSRTIIIGVENIGAEWKGWKGRSPRLKLSGASDTGAVFFANYKISSLADPKRCFDVSSKQGRRGPDSFFSPVSLPNSPPLTVPFTRTRTIWVLSHSHDSGPHWGTRFDSYFIWSLPFLVNPLQHTLPIQMNGSYFVICDYSTVV